MYKYVVHILPVETAPYAVRNGQGERAQAYANIDKEESRGLYEHGDMTMQTGSENKVSTWYADDEAGANMLARLLAQQKPGREVYMLELKAMAVAPPSKPIVSKLTEKGLLPE